MKARYGKPVVPSRRRGQGPSPRKRMTVVVALLWGRQTGRAGKKKLAESAETLAEVNAALAAEIKKQRSDAGRETQQG